MCHSGLAEIVQWIKEFAMQIRWLDFNLWTQGGRRDDHTVLRYMCLSMAINKILKVFLKTHSRLLLLLLKRLFNEWRNSRLVRMAFGVDLELYMFKNWFPAENLFF